MVEFAPLPVRKFVGDYTVTGTYRLVGSGQPQPALVEVTISLADEASEAAARRGITTGTLRRIENAVKELAAEAPEHGKGEALRYEARAEAALAALEGRSPRGDATYYRDLLDASEYLRLAGDRQSAKTLSDRLGVTKGTINSRLVTARREREDAIRAAEAEGIV